MSDSRNLRIKRPYSLIAHSADDVELRYGVWNPISFSLSDESESGHLFRILKRLDGSISPTKLAAQEGISREEVESLIDRLVGLGVMERGSASAIDYYVDHFVPTQRNIAPIAETQQPVLIVGNQDLGDEIRRLLCASLPELEISVIDGSDRGWATLCRNDDSWLRDGLAFQEQMESFLHWRRHFMIFACKTINPVRLRMFNRVALELELDWLHVALDGPFILVGPTFVPSRSACYECLETRVFMNMRDAPGYRRYKNALVEGNITFGRWQAEPVVETILCSHGAMEALNFLLTGSSFTVGKILTIYLPTMEFTFNELLRVPGCKACGALSLRDENELYFDVKALL